MNPRFCGQFCEPREQLWLGHPEAEPPDGQRRGRIPIKLECSSSFVSKVYLLFTCNFVVEDSLCVDIISPLILSIAVVFFPIVESSLSGFASSSETTMRSLMSAEDI